MMPPNGQSRRLPSTCRTPRLITMACFALLISLAMGAVPAIAQSTDLPEASYESGSETLAKHLFATTDHRFASAVGTDLSAQITDMEGRLLAQEIQIATLRSDLQSPSEKGCKQGAARWFSSYENAIVQPLQGNTTGLIVQTDDGFSHVAFPWKLESSPRVQFGYETTNDSLGWRVRYWQFRHGNSFQANEPNGLLVAPNIGKVGYLSEDGDITLGLDFIEEGRFTSSIRTDVIDWELQRHVAGPLDAYAGIRYAKVAQRYAAVTDAGNAWADSSLRGIGPTVAMRLKHDLALNRLQLFANLRGSLLFGQKRFSVFDDANESLQTIGSENVNLSSDGGDTLSSNAEFQVGLRFVPSDWIAFTVAFEAQTFSNVGGPNPTGIFAGDDSALSGSSPMDDSISFAGVTVGTELTW